MRSKLLRFIMGFFIILPLLKGYSQIVTERPVITASGNQAETAIAINPTNRNHFIAVWNERTSGKPGYGITWNKGISWITGDITPSQTHPGGFDPSIGFNLNGDAFYGYITDPISGLLGSAYISILPNGSSIWTDHNSASPFDERDDKSFIAVDHTGGQNDGNIYISWTHFSSNYDSTYIYFSRSTNGGYTFENPILLTFSGSDSNVPLSKNNANVEIEGPFVTGSMPAVGPSGEVYVAWLDAQNGSEGEGYIKIVKSTDGGQSFNSPVTAMNIDVAYTIQRQLNIFPFTYSGIRSSSFPSISINPINGYVYIATIIRTDEQDFTDVVFNKSQDGINWIPTSYIKPTPSISYYETLPWLSVDEIGNLYLIYYTNRNTQPKNSNTNINVYLLKSTNNGVSFETQTRITSQGSSPFPLVPGTSYSHTDYIGITSYKSFAYPCWVDFRNNSADVYFAEVDYPPAAPDNLIASPNPGPGYQYFIAQLSWSANQEEDIARYEIFRKITNYGEIYQDWTQIGFSTNTYYNDSTLPFYLGGNFTLYYRIRAKDTSGQISSYSNTASIENITILPKQASSGDSTHDSFSISYELISNYPNPFNTSTTFQFSIPEDNLVEITLYDIKGNEVAKLIYDWFKKGVYTKNFSADNLSSGIYFYRLTAGKFTEVKRMLLLK